MPLLSGQLRDQIDIYNELTALDAAYNERQKSYQYGFSVRTEFTFVGGVEKMLGQMNYADKVFKFKVRYCINKFNERQYIKFNGDYYNLRSIDPDRDRRYMILKAERIPTSSITIAP